MPTGARPFLRAFNEQVLESLEIMALSLPDKDLQPGDTWGHDVRVHVQPGAKNDQNALFKLPASTSAAGSATAARRP